MRSKNPFAKVISNSLFFSIGTFVGKFVNIAMLPIYTYFLTDSEYGIVNTLTGFSALLCIITMLALRASLMRFYGEIEQSEKSVFVSTVFLVIIANTILVVGIIFAFRKFLMQSVFAGISFWPLIFFTLLNIIFSTIFTSYQTVLQAKQEGKEYTKSNILYMFVHAVLNIVFIVLLRKGANGYMVSLILANCILAIMGIVKLYKSNDITFKANWDYAKKAVKYSVPLVPHDLSNNISEYISKIYLNSFLSYAATGVFSIASQVSGMMSLVQTSLNLAFHPWFNEQMAEGEAGRENIKKFSVFIFSVYCYFCIVLSFFSKEALYFFASNAYRNAWRIVPIIAISLVIRFIYYTHVLAILYNVKASNFLSICSISGCLINLAASYLLIKNFGLDGAAYATVVYVIFLTIITVVYSNIMCKVDFGLGKISLILLATIGVMAAGLFFDYNGEDTILSIRSFLYKISIVIVVTGVVLFEYRKQLKEFYLMIRRKR